MNRLDYAISAGSLGLAVAVAVAGIRSAPTPRPVMAYLPDPKLTPGAVVPGVTRDQTCDPGYARRVRDVPDSVKDAVMRRQGIDPTPINKKAYEIDHRVPLSVGGSNDMAILSAEPWDGPYNAHMKDRVEFWAFKQVCAGRLTIGQAQAIFLGDWGPVYAREFGDPSRPKFGASGPGGDDDEGDEEGFDRPREDRP